MKLLASPVQDRLLSELVQYLQIVQQLYYTPFLRFVVPQLNTAQDRQTAFSKLRKSFEAIVTYSLPLPKISTLLDAELTKGAVVILGIEDAKQEREGDMLNDGMDIDRNYSTSYRVWREVSSAAARNNMMTETDDDRIVSVKEELISLLQAVQDVGLGGDRAQKIFAGAMNNMMTEFITTTYAGQWESPSLAIPHLRLWTENVFARLAVEVLHVVRPSPIQHGNDRQMEVSLSDVGKWQEIAVARLGALRTSELFDVIVEWDSSTGAIDDLRQYANNPGARYSLTAIFIGMLNQRLLHPGASTVEILQLYISIIRAFSLLDPKGVLLDRIARPIRKYLRDRDDTIRVIVGGLLADTSETDTDPNAAAETLMELSTELSNAHQRSLQSDSAELDWDDMNWMPDPIDAAADYKKSKGSDVIGSLISLFDSKEAFVKELQTMLSDRLLKKKTDFSQELSVLELLKVRFGDGALQGCEVMLRDVFDSRRVDAAVLKDQGMAGKQLINAGPTTPDKATTVAEESEDRPHLHAKILSRFFWPAIQDQPFNIPSEIASLQQRYASGFESLKQSRKLTWLNGLGQVTVELDLEDRVFTDEVSTWQATVIYAFQSDSDSEPTTVKKTVSELSEQLAMSAAPVRSACLFWVSKRILTEVERDSFRVLEVLSSEEERATAGTGGPDASEASLTESNAAAAADAAAAVAAKETAHAAAMEKMNLYWQFIVGMLTNQGAMPLQRIVMMLKIAVPGGFPFSNEELREFLASMVSQGKLEIASGGSYKIIPER